MTGGGYTGDCAVVKGEKVSDYRGRRTEIDMDWIERGKRAPNKRGNAGAIM